jgi:hypothetical protein
MNQQKPSMAVPAVIGGAFLGVTSAIPLLNAFNCCCCLLVIGGGALAAFLYLRSCPPDSPRVTYGDGALLGLLTGAVGAVVWTIVELPLAFFQMRWFGTHYLGRLHDVLDRVDLPRQVVDLLEEIAASGHLHPLAILITAGRNLLVALVFATIGAVLGVALFQKRPPTPPTHIASAPPPPFTRPTTIPAPPSQAGPVEASPAPPEVPPGRGDDRPPTAD